MIFIYIIGGLICLALGIWFIDRREKLVHEKDKIKDLRKDIDEANRQLDDLHLQLKQMDEPIKKANHICSQILSYRK